MVMAFGSFWGKKQSTQQSAIFVTREQKVKAGIDFAINRYGETFKDLDRYDRGEAFSN
jgi:hypothetical protein